MLRRHKLAGDNMLAQIGHDSAFQMLLNFYPEALAVFRPVRAAAQMWHWCEYIKPIMTGGCDRGIARAGAMQIQAEVFGQTQMFENIVEQFAVARPEQ